MPRSRALPISAGALLVAWLGSPVQRWLLPRVSPLLAAHFLLVWWLGTPLRVPEFGVGTNAASSLASRCHLGSVGLRNLVDPHPVEMAAVCIWVLLARVAMSHFL